MLPSRGQAIDHDLGRGRRGARLDSRTMQPDHPARLGYPQLLTSPGDAGGAIEPFDHANGAIRAPVAVSVDQPDDGAAPGQRHIEIAAGAEGEAARPF